MYFLLHHIKPLESLRISVMNSLNYIKPLEFLMNTKIVHTLNFGNNHNEMKVSCRILGLMGGGGVGVCCLGFFLWFWLFFWVFFHFFNQQLLRSWQILRIRQIRVPCVMTMPVALLCLQPSGKLQCHSKYMLIILYSAHQERIRFENYFSMQLKT